MITPEIKIEIQRICRECYLGNTVNPWAITSIYMIRNDWPKGLKSMDVRKEVIEELQRIKSEEGQKKDN